jgi:cytochrome P450
MPNCPPSTTRCERLCHQLALPVVRGPVEAEQSVDQPRAAERLRTACTDVISELVCQASGSGRCDAVPDIARRYPIPIICELLGTRREDWNLFSDWEDDVFKVSDWNVVNDEADDLLSDMMRAEIDGDRLSHHELLTLAATLLMAGTDSTRDQLAAAVEVFCDHPDQWALLAEHPELAPKAVEEAMRYSPVICTTFRIAVEDVDLAGYTIPAGTAVIANTAAANRNPAVYPHPEPFDITREDPPAIRRDGPTVWKPIIGITGPETLPIAFDSGD